MHAIGGMQKYLPQVIALFAPFVNSYRRLVRFNAAPINVQWGYDNRTCGIRVPYSKPEARRIENRLPGVVCNPYIALAATLACLKHRPPRILVKCQNGEQYIHYKNWSRHEDFPGVFERTGA